LRGSTLIADRVTVIGQQKVKKPSVELEAKPAKIGSTLLKIGLTAVEPQLNSSWTNSRTKVQPLLLTVGFSISNLHQTLEVEPSNLMIFRENPG
jgi:hypothetical protein